jgi:hypothetical protein
MIEVEVTYPLCLSRVKREYLTSFYCLKTLNSKACLTTLVVKDMHESKEKIKLSKLDKLLKASASACRTRYT